MTVALVSAFSRTAHRYHGADRFLRRLPLARCQDAVFQHPFPAVVTLVVRNPTVSPRLERDQMRCTDPDREKG